MRNKPELWKLRKTARLYDTGPRMHGPVAGLLELSEGWRGANAIDDHACQDCGYVQCECGAFRYIGSKRWVTPQPGCDMRTSGPKSEVQRGIEQSVKDGETLSVLYFYSPCMICLDGEKCIGHRSRFLVEPKPDHVCSDDACEAPVGKWMTVRYNGPHLLTSEPWCGAEESRACRCGDFYWSPENRHDWAPWVPMVGEKVRHVATRDIGTVVCPPAPAGEVALSFNGAPTAHPLKFLEPADACKAPKEKREAAPVGKWMTFCGEPHFFDGAVKESGRPVCRCGHCVFLGPSLWAPWVPKVGEKVRHARTGYVGTVIPDASLGEGRDGCVAVEDEDEKVPMAGWCRIEDLEPFNACKAPKEER